VIATWMHSHFTAATRAFGQFQYPTSPLFVRLETQRAAIDRVGDALGDGPSDDDDGSTGGVLAAV
jgi:hypothetical protein